MNTTGPRTHKRTRGWSLTILLAVIGFLAVGHDSAAAKALTQEPGCRYVSGSWYCSGMLPPGVGPDITRLGGANRYETAAAIAAYTQDPEERVIIIASAAGVDAITAGTWLSGPTLLVPHGGPGVPQATIDAAVTYQPDRLIVLGGTAAVTEGQAQAIRTAIYGGTP